MNRIDIPEVGYTGLVPASHAEMTRPQVLYVMRQIHDLKRGVITLSEFRVRCLYRLLGVVTSARSVRRARMHPDEITLRAEQVTLLAEQLLGFLFVERNESLLPAYDCIVNHLPVLRIGRRRLVGPSDGLVDLSFGELIAADADLLRYTTTRDEQYVDQMIARIYRRPGPMQPSGRRIEPFDTERTPFYARLIRRLPAWQKQLILLWYAACVHNLQHGTFFVNGREVSFEPLFAGTDTDGNSLGWLSVQFDLAEKRIFGGMEATARTNVIDVLALLLNYKNTADHVKKSTENH